MALDGDQAEAYSYSTVSDRLFGVSRGLPSARSGWAQERGLIAPRAPAGSSLCQ